jgi:hypothetical protein
MGGRVSGARGAYRRHYLFLPDGSQQRLSAVDARRMVTSGEIRHHSSTGLEVHYVRT